MITVLYRLFDSDAWQRKQFTHMTSVEQLESQLPSTATIFLCGQPEPTLKVELRPVPGTGYSVGDCPLCGGRVYAYKGFAQIECPGCGAMYETLTRELYNQRFLLGHPVVTERPA